MLNKILFGASVWQTDISGAGDLTAQPAQLFFVAFVLPPAPPSQSPMAEPGLMCPPWCGPSPRSTLCPWQVAPLLVLFPACLLWPAHVTCCDWSPGRVSITALPSQPPGPLRTPLFFVVPRCPQLARLTEQGFPGHFLLLVTPGECWPQAICWGDLELYPKLP